MAEQTAIKRAEALSYRKMGYGYAQIGTFLTPPCSEVYARKLVLDALQSIYKEPANELLTLELERLDEMLVSLHCALSSGDPMAITTALRIMERRSKYTGLDAATKIETTGKDGGAIEIRSQEIKDAASSFDAKFIEVLAKVGAAGIIEDPNS